MISVDFMAFVKFMKENNKILHLRKYKETESYSVENELLAFWLLSILTATHFNLNWYLITLMSTVILVLYKKDTSNYYIFNCSIWLVKYTNKAQKLCEWQRRE